MTSLVAGVLCIAAVASTAAATQDDSVLAQQEQEAFQQAAALVSPSVVRIETVGGLDRLGRFLTASGPTTGVIVSEDGYIITSSFNFVSKPSSVIVVLPDERRLPAQIVASDQARMLTLLKVEATGLTPAQPVPKKSIQVGQWAIALGRTFESSFPNVSVGIVSALNRIWGKAIQTDAKVSPVNYGGPLIDIEGRVMGILVPLSPQGRSETAGVEWYDSGIGFAIPLEDVYAILPRLKKGEDLLPGRLGITLKATDLYAPEPKIDRVRYNSPAQKAGLKPGDRILKIDDQVIRRFVDVRQALGTKLAGDTIQITVRRGEKQIARTVTLVAELEPYQSAFLGILPERVSTPDSVLDRTPAGVPIRFVFPESPADRAGLQRGDVITHWEGRPTPDAAALLDAVSRARPGQTVKIRFRRPAEAAAADTEEAEVTLATIPDNIPDRLPAAPLPAVPADATAADQKAADTGQLLRTEPKTKREYWAYVPEDYTPQARYGLLIWIGPAATDMQKQIVRLWKPTCQTHGWLLLGIRPARGRNWTPEDVEIARTIVDAFREHYSVDAQRIVVHGYADGGRLATQLAFRHRELVRGLLLASSALSGTVPENRPEYRLQFLLACGDQDEAWPFVEQAVKMVRRMKFPCSVIRLKDQGRQYPGDETVRQMARWLDMLDRI
ncbi:MAG: PDZ domain-containing protein [Planctomycetes bacterium]|nr:PDZ domain-containing protein [Planctomycetota bacterium]